MCSIEALDEARLTLPARYSRHYEEESSVEALFVQFSRYARRISIGCDSQLCVVWHHLLHLGTRPKLTRSNSRIAKLKEGECIIGMKSFAMIPLISFDAIVNVYLTIMFLIPLRSAS